MTEPIIFGRPFVLRRDRDISDVSGVGIIADGILFPDGHAAIHWRGKWPLTTPHPDGMDSIIAIHDHGGRGDLHVIWADHDETRRKALADVVEAYDVPAEMCGPEAERAYLHGEIERAIHDADGHSCQEQDGVAYGRLADVVMPIVDKVLEQRDRAQAAAGRAYKLADRWEAVRGVLQLVRVAGAELRDVLDAGEERPVPCGRSATLTSPCSAGAWCCKGPGAAEQPATEAHPPHYRWYTETRDGLADEWAPGMRSPDRAEAMTRYRTISERHPLWKDGTPVQRRFVRETTTYTVEEPAPAAPQPAAADNEDPARIDRLRPEYADHASVESIDVQLRRARAQERRWHIRTEWLISLRAARVAQKERGEWPAAEVRQDAEPRKAEIACSLAVIGQPHSPHEWEPQPGVDSVRCAGSAAGARQDGAETIPEAQAEHLATLTDCPTSHNNGLHCNHYQEGDGPCCDCQRPNWCPSGGVA